MTRSRSQTRNPISFAGLMRLGQASHAQGDTRTAHEYWQKAAMLEPDNEQVWTALMWVIEDDEDRKVCLKNIITLNPDNLQAQQMLDDLVGETQPQIQEEAIIADVIPDKAQSKLNIDFLRVILLGTILGFGTAVSIVLLQMIIA